MRIIIYYTHVGTLTQSNILNLKGEKGIRKKKKRKSETLYGYVLRIIQNSIIQRDQIFVLQKRWGLQTFSICLQ